MQKPKAPSKKSEKVQNYPGEFIIGIGASAGGMDAIHTLFDHTPTDAVSHVIIQHLSPDYKSFMAELLVQHSKLKVFKAETGLQILNNCVYVMPEGKNMTLLDGKFILTDREKSTPNSAIDIFFNSLAEELGNKSIGIVLSGNGADGTKGIAAIKKVGGMVIVQDPGSTDFDSMPKSAIASGNFDYILAPKLIPQQIVNYVAQNTLLKTFPDPKSDKDEAALVEIIELVKKQTPLDFTEYKRPTIVRRIIRRMAATNSSTINGYISILKDNPTEAEVLAQEFMISVTSFFRDKEAFEIIREQVIPSLVANKLLLDTLKVWVIGCATGEEAYSLAILIREHLIEIKKDLEVKIFASDIDKTALAKAATGIFGAGIKQHVSDKRLAEYFTVVPTGYQVKEDIRKMIIFANHDIVHHPPYGKIDLISCRNLLIYLNPVIQKKIFSTLHFCLNVGGYLFLGPSEGIGDLKDAFSEVDKQWKIYRNQKTGTFLSLNSFSPQQIEIKPQAFTVKPSGARKTSVPANLPELLLQSQLEETGYMAGVCIDQNNKVLLPFGSYDKFLLPKLFNDHLPDLLPDGLAVAVANTIKKVLQTGQSAEVKQIHSSGNTEGPSTRIFVKSVSTSGNSAGKNLLVYFAYDEEKATAEISSELYAKDDFDRDYLANTVQELADVKTELAQAYQALDDSNENVQSYNEELISGNEEMQSSNEELQSMNEELNTVNTEYKHKIKELAELNDDFNNYFRNTYNSQIYVDKNLIIKKFTPVAIKQINIKETDIGRPLADISTNIKFSHLIEDIREVISSKLPAEKEVETTDGRWYLMMISPYIRSRSGKSDGAIITFNDITIINAARKLVEANNSRLSLINRDHGTFIYSVAHDLKSPLNNIEGLVGLIDDTDERDEIAAVTAQIKLSVQRLKETIDELSDITKIESESENATEVDIQELLEEVKLSIGIMLLDANATFTTNLQTDKIFFSKKNLRSIILNLLTNAIKYRSPDRDLSIQLTTKQVNGVVQLCVKDNGMGISAYHQSGLFTKFNRANQKNKTIDGTGIGLYLVQKLLSNAGGHIEVESTVDVGSEFTVYFK